MSKLEDKYKVNYSLATLRDVALTAITNNDFIVYNSTTSKFENKKQPRFGNDFKEQLKSTPSGEIMTGNVFQPYDTILFDVTGPDTINKYRVSCDFVLNHNSAANDFRAQLVIDGVAVGEEMRLEVKDAGSDQRGHYNLKWYASNLSIAQHTVSLVIRPASKNRLTRVYQSITEIWRVS
tara:strand:+ start:6723 stop:7259 length:537 start_codon:yes stop_codon:yes gene_type:complete